MLSQVFYFFVLCFLIVFAKSYDQESSRDQIISEGSHQIHPEPFEAAQNCFYQKKSKVEHCTKPVDKVLSDPAVDNALKRHHEDPTGLPEDVKKQICCTYRAHKFCVLRAMDGVTVEEEDGSKSCVEVVRNYFCHVEKAHSINETCVDYKEGSDKCLKYFLG